MEMENDAVSSHAGISCIRVGAAYLGGMCKRMRGWMESAYAAWTATVDAVLDWACEGALRLLLISLGLPLAAAAVLVWLLELLF